MLDKTSTPLRDTKIERRNSNNSNRVRSSLHQQDSLEDVPDLINNNNQDVSGLFLIISVAVENNFSVSVHCGITK